MSRIVGSVSCKTNHYAAEAGGRELLRVSRQWWQNRYDVFLSHWMVQIMRQAFDVYRRISLPGKMDVRLCHLFLIECTHKPEDCGDE
ncbi:hypothetical protein [Marininema mesophilum]|uniref:hypothetical protein n=1 Tax=Marininema mesophilum TaxID=1048340 RepID=UPI00115FF217|nr:hypothetical protein [Marininema mesophilum]